MSYTYVVRPRADRDFDEIADNRSMKRASISRCKIRRPGFAEVKVFRVSGYFEKILLFYCIESGQIEVIRVLHGAQDLEALFARSPID